MLDLTPAALVKTILAKLEAALAAQDLDAALDLFGAECFWRDLVSFTWNIKTLEGRGEIRAMLAACLTTTEPKNWALKEDEAITEDGGVILAWHSFETNVARGVGLIRIKDGKIWALLTTMAELKGHEEKIGVTRPFGARHGVHPGAKSWAEEREAEIAAIGRTVQPYALIIGGGQGGMALGARLRQLNVPALIVDRHERPGDAWRKRYKSLCLHDPVWYDHMPYLEFPRNWPVYSPKDKIADWLEMYAKVMELNYWTHTAATKARYDADAKEWSVEVDRAGERVTLRPKHLVFATGMSGKPNMPRVKGQQIFRGEQQHSSQHPGPDAYRGKRVVVIGSNNSAHDICAALYEAGVDVTMVQRSSTLVVRSEVMAQVGLRELYSERSIARGITVDKADLMFAAIPFRLLARFQKPAFDKIREIDRDFYAGLEKVGFLLDFGADDSGLFTKYVRRGSGYYIDVGASQLVIEGKIKLAVGQVSELTEEAVLLETGARLPADLIVYATGYNSMNGWIADLIDQPTADRVGKVWGVGSDTPLDPGPWEGELRNMWKPTQQDALWLQGGNLHQSRHYSQFLALQLKARMAGVATPVYQRQNSHHST
jgi:putative flavoprotein involved in K+ transport